MSGIIRYAGWYSPALCQLHPEKTFVFGDNLLGFGKGGQAIIRDEPNAFGVPTKRKPSMADGSFFSEHSTDDLNSVLNTLGDLWTLLKEGATVIIPVTESGLISLGLERAELRQRAPSIYETIVQHVDEMQNAYGVTYVHSEESLAEITSR